MDTLNTLPLVIEPQFKPSRFTLTARVRSDGSAIILNTLSGAIIQVPDVQVAEVRALLEATVPRTLATIPEHLHYLAEQGFLVPASRNEDRILRHVALTKTTRHDNLHLIVLPTEQCNFRCPYCYESFEKGLMSEHIQARLEDLLRARVPRLRHLALDWFGGEPLLGLPVVRRIGRLAKDLVEAAGCRFTSHVTTNGYLLTPTVAAELVQLGVTSFQITLDGPPETHNTRRILASATQGTFDRIVENLRGLLAIREIFAVTIRVNYDRDSLSAIPDFISWLAANFGEDLRVRVDFQPIWVEPGETAVSACMGKERQLTQIAFFETARKLGLRVAQALDAFTPGGYVCYAAKANSLVVRSDGRLNKCTVALDSDYNNVGELLDGGGVRLDLDRVTLWTGSGLQEAQTCQSCQMAPSCQGNACPLERIENKRRPCPPAKNHGARWLPLLSE
ncbi:MAG: radical SAM protein [Polyangiaceae bacterium]|nr:radical SAM protein [Polyangiaceae bacterium]